LNDNGTTAARDTETTKPVETQGDFLTRWGANDIYAKVDRNTESAKPIEKPVEKPLDKPVEDKPVEEQNASPPPSAANDTSAPAGSDAETAASVQARDDLPPPPGANDNPPAERHAETATVSKEPETPIVVPSGPTPPARRDEAERMKVLVEPDEETDSSAVMHARGIAAYRNGDLKLALADFNRAIALDPTFMLAYVNRGIVHYRMGKLALALADVARAKQIGRAGRTRSAAAFHRKRRHDVSVIEDPAFMQAAGL
jgi:tetratricopeptide (TPR) repeat protein